MFYWTIIKDFSRIAKRLYVFLSKPKAIKNNTRENSSKKSIGQRSSQDLIDWTSHHQNLLSIFIDKMKSSEVMS